MHHRVYLSLVFHALYVIKVWLEYNFFSHLLSMQYRSLIRPSIACGVRKNLKFQVFYLKFQKNFFGKFDILKKFEGDVQNWGHFCPFPWKFELTKKSEISRFYFKISNFLLKFQIKNLEIQTFSCTTCDWWPNEVSVVRQAVHRGLVIVLVSVVLLYSSFTFICCYNVNDWYNVM